MHATVMLGKQAVSGSDVSGDNTPLRVNSLGQLEIGRSGLLYPGSIVPPLTGAYANGDAIGGGGSLLTPLLDTQGGFVDGLVVLDVSNQKAPFDILFFASTPATTFTDNAAVSLDAADHLNYLGKVSVAASDYTTYGTVATATLRNLRLPVYPGATMRYGIVCRGTPTYAGANDLKILVWTSTGF